MKLSETLLPEFNQEMATTRKLLERVPDDRLDWQPHDKSMSLGRLATHLAEVPALAALIIHRESFDIAAGGGSGQKPTSRQEIVDLFDANVRNTRAAIESAENDALLQPWTLQKGDHVVFTLPRVAALRALVLSHTIHHRGQLSVYLRLNDVPVPSVYGPTADEAF
jgi:uncharacterized damage-inducible protein DinB